MRDGDGFQVAPSDLHVHATTVGAVADEVETAGLRDSGQRLRTAASNYGSSDGATAHRYGQPS